MAFHHPVTIWERQTCQNRRCVLLDTPPKTLQFCNATATYSIEPNIQRRSLMLMEHGHEALSELIDRFHVRVHLTKLLQGFLFYRS